MRRRTTTSRGAAAALDVQRTVVAPARHAHVTLALIAALLLVTPLVVTPSTKESFRLVKGLAAGWLGLASLIPAAWALRQVGAVPWRVLDRPLVRAVLPLTVVILAGAWWTPHPVHFRAAAADYAIGIGCAVGWSLALPGQLLRRALHVTILPAAIVSVLTIDQALGLFGLLDGLGVTAPTARLALTATLGNPGDIGASLVLPSGVGALLWLRRPMRAYERGALSMALGLMAAALVASGTLAALAAVVTGASVAVFAVRGSEVRRPIVIGAVLALLAVAIAAPPVLTRVTTAAGALTQGDLNTMLTGRLDGWRAAVEMIRVHPLTGVGQGAFRAAYADTRLSLMDRGVGFYEAQDRVMFATPHNEALSVAAEQGWPGVIALAWGAWCLLAATAKLHDTGERVLARAALAALAILSLAWFPMHVASVAWPWLVFFAWLDRRAMESPA